MDLREAYKKPLAIATAALVVAAGAFALREQLQNDDSPRENVPTLTEQDTLGSVLSDDEISIIEQTASKELTGDLSLITRIEVDDSDKKINVVAGETNNSIHPEDFISMLTDVGKLASKGGDLTFVFPEDGGKSPLPQTYEYSASPETFHYFVLSPYKSDMPAPAYTSFNSPREQNGHTVSVLASTQLPTRFTEHVNADHFSAAVEICNSLMSTQITEESKQLMIDRAAKKGLEIEDSAGLDTALLKVGQELACNSLAAAISFAKSGISYDEYKDIISKQRLSALGPAFSGYYAVLGEKAYMSFAETQFKGYVG